MLLSEASQRLAQPADAGQRLPGWTGSEPKKCAVVDVFLALKALRARRKGSILAFVVCQPLVFTSSCS